MTSHIAASLWNNKFRSKELSTCTFFHLVHLKNLHPFGWKNNLSCSILIDFGISSSIVHDNFTDQNFRSKTTEDWVEVQQKMLITGKPILIWYTSFLSSRNNFMSLRSTITLIEETNFMSVKKRKEKTVLLLHQDQEHYSLSSYFQKYAHSKQFISIVIISMSNQHQQMKNWNGVEKLYLIDLGSKRQRVLNDIVKIWSTMVGRKD